MLTSHEKLSFFFLLVIVNFLGMAVTSQIEITIRHEFLQIHETKEEFGNLIKEQAHWEGLVSLLIIL